jgi:hypothetical protein
MASCTAVSVLLRGRFWVCEVRERLERLGRGRMRREARKITCRSENFFSSSRVRLNGFLLATSLFSAFWGTSLADHVPLLDLVETGEKGNGHKDDDGFLAVASFDLENGSVSKRYPWSR